MKHSRSEYAAYVDLSTSLPVIQLRPRKPHNTSALQQSRNWLVDLALVPVVYVIVRLAQLVMGPYK